MKKNVPKEGTESPKIRHRDRCASEERILKAAKEIFAKLGFNGATTKMIAKKADMNESLIGRYFQGKYGLLLTLIQKLIVGVKAMDLPYVPQETLTKELQEFCNFKINHMLSNEGFFKIIISQSLTDPKFLKQAREKLPMDFDNPQLEARIKKLYTEKKLKADINLEQIFNDIDVHCMGVFFFRLVLKGEELAVVQKDLNKFIENYASVYEA
jgi:DNA-directed RNA polymerase subunit L